MIMKLRSNIFAIGFLLLGSACSLEESGRESMLIFLKDFDFSESDHEWVPGFSDYPAGPDDSARFELKYAYTEPLDESLLTKRSVMLSGKNLNQDLFMYLKRKITRLQPNTDYIITFNVELASNLDYSQQNATGSVCLKAGATGQEPMSLKEGDYYVLNLDKGEVGKSGKDMISLGDIRTQSNTTGYTLISRNNTMANSRYVARSNSQGELWLVIGTDSSLEGTTTVFYSRVNIVFSTL